MRATTNNIYTYSKKNSLPLLGTNSFDFWAPYAAAYNVYDRYFRDKFFSWFYWINFDENTAIEDIYDDFIDAVQAFITVNNKRYAELFRVEVLSDTAYDIVNNYDLTETHTATRSDSSTDISGSRTDSTSGNDIIGGHTDTHSATNVSGAREDSQSGSATDGARSDSASTTAGAQTTTRENQIEGFNSASYKDADKTTEIAGAHTDSTSVSKGSQTNTTSSSLNKGEQTDTVNESNIYASHTDTHTGNTTKGQQTDTHTGSGSESVNIRRYGNIGVQTPADIIGGHIKLWESFNFYKMIFDEIAKEFLLLDQCYDTVASGTISNESIIMEELRKLELKIDQTAKSSELTGLAKTSDLAGLAKSSELTGLAKSSELTGLAKTSDLAGLAKTSDLAGLAKSSELTGLAKSSELTGLAKSSELTGLAKTSDLAGLATAAGLTSIELDVNALRASTLQYKNDIIGSIEGVSTDEY